jgi:hypothetical protein
MSDTNGSGRGFGYWLNIFANLAVVAGIVFLGMELRQNSQVMRAQVRNDITQNIFGSADRALTPEVVAAYERAMTGDEPRATDEYVFGLVTRATFRSFENTQYQYGMGLFDESEYRANLAFMESYLRDTTGIDRTAWWQENRMQFSEGLRQVIDSLVALH